MRRMRESRFSDGRTSREVLSRPLMPVPPFDGVDDFRRDTGTRKPPVRLVGAPSFPTSRKENIYARHRARNSFVMNFRGVFPLIA